MTSKLKTYILLALVLCVWGIIGYRIFSAVNPTRPTNMINEEMLVFKPKATKIKDTFSIQPVDRDPFLGKLYVSKKKAKGNTTKQHTVEWLSITYHGNISKKNDKQQIFIVTIDKTQYLMKIGQTIKNIKLLKGNSSNVTMIYKGNRKIVHKR